MRAALQTLGPPEPQQPPPPSQPGPQPPARFLPWQPIWADAESWGLYFWSSVVSFDSLWVLIYFEINQLLSPKMNEAHTHPQLRGDLELPLQLPPPGFFQLRGPLRVMHFLPVRCFLQLPMVSRRNHLTGACAPQPPRTPHGSRPAPPPSCQAFWSPDLLTGDWLVKIIMISSDDGNDNDMYSRPLSE